jgi:hypothetical protein
MNPFIPLNVQFSIATEAHFHRFFGDFDGLLAEQIIGFDAKCFETFVNRFKHFQMRDDKLQTVDDVRELYDLFMESYKYDTLFLSKGEIPMNHPIYKTPGLPIIAETELIDAIRKIESTKMVTINEQSLIYHCLIHLRMKFLMAISEGFYIQYIKFAQANRKRDKVSPSTMKPSTKTMRDRQIRDQVGESVQGVFGNGPEIWKNMIKTMSPKKNNLRLPNFASSVGMTPIKMKAKASKGMVYQSMVPLIRLLSPEFPIMDSKMWSEKNGYDEESQYRSFYLSNRVKEFDPSGILIR